MSKNKSGYIVEFVHVDGTTKRGNQYHEDQRHGFKENGYVAIEETDASGNQVMRNGKRNVLMVKLENVKQIGFIH